MSLPLIFRQRLRLFIGRITKTPPRPFPGTTTLLEATRFDDTSLDILFRRALNRDDAIGMGDVLKSSFNPGELKGTTKLDDVLATIAKRSRAGSVDAYRALIAPRVRDEVVRILADAQLPPAHPDDIAGTDPIARYVTEDNVGDVAKECDRRLDKWLLSLVTTEDFASTLSVDGVLDNLLARMVVL